MAMEFAITAAVISPWLMTPGSLAAPGVFCLQSRGPSFTPAVGARDWRDLAISFDRDLWRPWHARPLRPPGYRAGPHGQHVPFRHPAGKLVRLLPLGLIGQFTLNRLVISPDWRVAIAVGFLGGYTTFSSFSWETAKMLEAGEWAWATAYVGASVFAGLLLSVAGIRLANQL
jgi:CrcB protein